MGIGLGPVTGGILLEYFLGGSVFFINIPIVLIAIIAGLILVPESKTPNPVPLQLDSSPYLI
jgi:DHA2 family multidrug resistance protein-like MFS transporter